MMNICKKDCEWFLCGTILGSIIGMMISPKCGKEMREDMMKIIEGVDKEFNKTIKELEQDINDLDKEKNINKAKEKAENILEQANNLVDSAIKDKKPKLKKMASDMQKKARAVTESVLDNLE